MSRGASPKDWRGFPNRGFPTPRSPGWGGRMVRKPALIGAVALAFVALTPRVGLSAPRPIVEIQDDNFSPAATFTGPAQAVNPFGGTFRLWHLRSWVNKTNHSVEHQLYIQTTYLGHWRFWEQAADDHADLHPIVPISRNVNDCTGECDYDETIGVTLEDDFVRAHAQSGFQIKLTAHSGDTLLLTVTPEQIQPVLAAIDVYRAKQGFVAPLPPRFGVVAGPISPVMATMLGKPDLKCAVVAAVAPGSVAERAGVKLGDCITEFDGQTVHDPRDLVAASRDAPAGKPLTTSAIRSGSPITLSFQFEEAPATQSLAPSPYPLAHLTVGDLGVTATDLGGFNRRLYYGMKSGLQVIRVEPGSVAGKAGITSWDWILDIDGVPLATDEDLKTAMGRLSFGSTAKATIKRKGQTQAVTLEF